MCTIDYRVKTKPAPASSSRFWAELVICTACIFAVCSPAIVRTLLDGEGNLTLEHVPSAVGLGLGLGAVAVGQLVTLVYYAYQVNRRPLLRGHSRKTRAELLGSLGTHISNPEGFYLLGLYLSATWLLNMMPASYYSFDGGVSLVQVFQQLLVADFFQFCMHYAEHRVSTNMYTMSHKPHHFFIWPRLTDAFDGSPTDTMLMILVPLFLTAHTVHCNVWSYMLFGAIYGNYLCLIHAEFDHPWDGVFTKLGICTAGHHRVHHSRFVYNYGHIFTYSDRVFGTYRAPINVGDTYKKRQ